MTVQNLKDLFIMSHYRPETEIRFLPANSIDTIPIEALDVYVDNGKNIIVLIEKDERGDI